MSIPRSGGRQDTPALHSMSATRPRGSGRDTTITRDVRAAQAAPRGIVRSTAMLQTGRQYRCGLGEGEQTRTASVRWDCLAMPRQRCPRMRDVAPRHRGHGPRSMPLVRRPRYVCRIDMELVLRAKAFPVPTSLPQTQQRACGIDDKRRHPPTALVQAP